MTGPVTTRVGPRKAEVSRQRILDAAARLFRQHGYSAVSLRNIADAGGMKAGSVYYHFSSKEEIVLEVLDTGIDVVEEQVASTVRGAAANRDAEHLLREAILAHLRTLFEYSDYTSANVRIFHQVPDDVRRANLAARRRYDALWDSILSDMQQQGGLRPGLDLKMFRQQIISSLNATLDWFQGGRKSIVELSEHYARVFSHGAMPEREQSARGGGRGRPIA